MTNTDSRTVGEIAAGSIAAVRVFEKYGIDYCCGGARPLEQVCDEKGIDASAVDRELNEASAAAGEIKDWNTAPLREIIRHIVTTHHEFLRAELPRISDRLAAVLKAHGARNGAALNELSEVFGALRSELEAHTGKEEAILFPIIFEYERAKEAHRPLPPAAFGSVKNPIAVMMAEHDDAGGALLRIRQITNDFAVPEYACNTYRALLQGLAELEADTHLHIHLENNILFPRAIKLERERA